MKRPLLIAAIGLLVVVVAIALNYVPWQPTDTDGRVVDEREEEAFPEGDPAARRDFHSHPTFDVVRIGPGGDAVIAGRAEPGSRVRIIDDGVVIGEVVADERGEWVFLPDAPLEPGTREFGLEMHGKNGEPVVSEDVVVLVVPQPGEDIAGRPAGEGAQALALRVPRSGAGATTVLQKPSEFSGDAVTAFERPAGAPVDAGDPGGREAAAVETPLPAEGDGHVTPRPRTPGATPEVGRAIAFTVDAIDYDADGRIIVSGRAPGNAAVHVYLSNRFIGRSVADRGGVWRLVPEDEIAPGLYTLRADQVDDAGKVAVRIELPFVRAEPIFETADERSIIVQPGNSLWRIARRTYGSGYAYAVIYDANRDQIRDPDRIYPGQIFALPATN